jgi:signal transduction histidine kinase
MRDPSWQSVARGYAVALAVTVPVVAGRWLLNPVLGLQSNRHLIFLPTVMLVSWLGGFGPGVLAAVLCTVAISLFWMGPDRMPWNPSLDLLLFFVIAVTIAALVASLRRARSRAAAAAKAQEQVLAVVAHDLLNPLAAIKMMSSALQEAPVDGPTLNRRLGAIDRAARRMENLIRDLVDATRIEHGGVQLSIQEERLENIVRDTLDLYTPLAREKGLTFEASASVGATTVPCDRERLMQVLGNLIGNALRFTPEGGVVSLGVEERADVVRFEVKDTGPGIPATDLPHIFDLYWHADPKGTGLGLFIAQSLVRAHGGRIQAESQPGHGAHFFFSLPRRPQPAPQARPSGDQQASGAPRLRLG